MDSLCGHRFGILQIFLVTVIVSVILIPSMVSGMSINSGQESGFVSLNPDLISQLNENPNNIYNSDMAQPDNSDSLTAPGGQSPSVIIKPNPQSYRHPYGYPRLFDRFIFSRSSDNSRNRNPSKRMGSEFLGKRMGSEFLGKRMGSEFLGKRIGSEFLGRRRKRAT